MMIEAIVDAKYYWDNRYYEKVGSEVKDITDELPFEIPDSWVWTRLESSVLINPRNDLSDNIDVSFVEMKSISDGYNNHFSATTRLWKEVKSGFTHFQDGDVGFAKITPCFQNRKSVVFSGLQNGYGAGTTELHILRAVKSTITTEYLLLFVKSSYFIERGIQKFSGTAGQQRFGTDEVKKTPFPLPPLEEQARIVNRIDELFEQIDIIEQNQADIDTLYDEFRKRTLTLAIQGKLVPQDPNDEPASVLLKRIRAEKKAKLGKKYVDSYIYKGDDNCYYEKVGTNEPARLDNLPFDIPDSWCWARLGNIGDWGAGATPARTNSQYYGGNIPWLKTGELNNDIVYGSEEHITDEALKECSLRYCRIGDVLIAMYGATIGKLAIAGVPLTTNQACCACTPYEGIYNFYLLYFLMEEKDNFTQMGFGGAQPNISKEKIIKHLFPVPPYEEQKEIVSTFISIQNILKDEN